MGDGPEGLRRCTVNPFIFSRKFCQIKTVRKLKVLDHPDEYSLTGEHIATQQSYRFLMCTKYGPIACQRL